MLSRLQGLTKSALQKFDITVLRHSSYKDQLADTRKSEDFELLLALPHSEAPTILDNISASKSQYRQDLFVLSELGWKRGGFFVEFGATNGVDISNTFMLETRFGWNGILAEPARRWHEELRGNRKCLIETDCVWKETGASLAFNEVSRTDLSTIAAFSDIDVWKNARKHGKVYQVRSISLTDMLDKHDAPRTIDYLSIDTEGSELDILRAFDFDKYTIKIITVEHNFTPLRQQLFDLLSSKGYRRKYESISHFDDWYIKDGAA